MYKKALTGSDRFFAVHPVLTSATKHNGVTHAMLCGYIGLALLPVVHCLKQGAGSHCDSATGLTKTHLIERIGLFRCRKPCILPNGPWSRGVHCGIWPARVGEHPRQLQANIQEGRLLALAAHIHC